MLTTSAEAKPLTSWLASAMKEVSIPQFRAKARTFAGERYTQFESRARSQFDIDHAAFR